MIDIQELKMQKQRKFGVVKKELIEKLSNLSKEDGERLLERFRYRLHEQKARVLEQAFGEKLISKEEYEKKYRDMFYDELGFDGFLQYLDAVMNAKGDYFATLNGNLIKRREKLEKKFKLKIITPEELEKIADEERKQ